MKKRKTQAVPDIRGVYQNTRGDKVTVTHVKGDIWEVKDTMVQKWRLEYESMVLFLQQHGYTRVTVLIVGENL